MRLTPLIAGAALSLAAATAALAAPADLGSNGVLVDGEGMTLYLFDNDKGGASTCYGGCAGSWPPFVAAAGAQAEGDFSLIERNDGSMQWAYKGWPLYYWAGDRQPGDMSGDGVGGVWHVLK